MAWLYLPAEGASTSASKRLQESRRSAMSKKTTTRPPASCPESGRGSLMTRPYGMTSAPSMDVPGAVRWISSLADSPARTSARQARVEELRLRLEVACGTSSCVLLARYDWASSSWRTSQRSIAGGSTQYSAAWPKKGTMRDGVAFRPAKSAHRISARGCLSLPTLQAFDSKAHNQLEGKEYTGTRHALKITQALTMPTLSAMDAWAPNLRSTQVRLGSRHSVKLHQVFQHPTLTVSDAKGAVPKRTPSRPRSRGLKASEMLRSSEDDPIYLNPSFAELFMGLPTGWSALDS